MSIGCKDPQGPKCSTGLCSLLEFSGAREIPNLRQSLTSSLSLWCWALFFDRQIGHLIFNRQSVTTRDPEKPVYYEDQGAGSPPIQIVRMLRGLTALLCVSQSMQATIVGTQPPKQFILVMLAFKCSSPSPSAFC